MSDLEETPPADYDDGDVDELEENPDQDFLDQDIVEVNEDGGLEDK